MFIPEAREWAYGSFDRDGLRDGIWRFHAEDGTSKRATTFVHGVKHGDERRYEGGQLVAQLTYERGVLKGPFWQKISAKVYRVAGAAVEIGTFDHGVRVGTLRLLDAADQELATYGLRGSTVDDETLVRGVLSTFPRPMSAWLDLANQKLAESHVEEGLLCLARAVARGADPSVLRSALERHVLPVTECEAERRAVAVQMESSPRRLLAAMLAGAAPVIVLRRLAGLVDRGRAYGSAAALDMIEAAIALAGDPVPLLFSRGLLRVLTGNVLGARQDAKTLRHVRPHEHELLLDAISALDELKEDRTSDTELSRLTLEAIPTVRVA